MTEMERILQKGIIKEDFLKEEIRCGFFVDSKRKRLWAIGLDLLCEFDRVCKKYDLKYFLTFGTLLGAVRHNGFIPWDDDVDVAMLREDYEKLQEVAKNEFCEPYFFQTPYTDEGYYFTFAKLRNSNSSTISKAMQYQPFNQGVCLDIFPLDYTEINEMEERYNKIKELAIQNSKYMKLSNPNFLIDEQEKKKILLIDPMKNYELIQNLAMKHYKDPRKYLAFVVWTNLDWSTYLYETRDYIKTIDVEFEGIKFPAPIGYDKILRVIFGDYMEFPPEEERGNCHAGNFVNPDVSYKEYLNGKC